MISISKALEIKYGGKWTYDRKLGQWNCNDEDRYVCNVLTGKDYDGEYTGESQMCLYHMKSNKPSEWVYLYRVK